MDEHKPQQQAGTHQYFRRKHRHENQAEQRAADRTGQQLAMQQPRAERAEDGGERGRREPTLRRRATEKRAVNREIYTDQGAL